jgi:hypothetical protein
MATEDNKKKEVNPLAQAKNWEDRLRSEAEAPHIWNESWGELFTDGIPHEYAKRVEYLEKKLETMPKIQPTPKYGQGAAFKEIKVGVDPRRKKMFQEGTYED